MSARRSALATLSPSRMFPTVVFTAVCLAVAAIACESRGAVKTADEKDGLRISSPYLDVKLSLRQPAILSLATDSLGLGKVGVNGLRAPAQVSAAFRMSRGEGGGRVWIDYRRQGTAAKVAPGWRWEVGERDLRMISQWSEAEQPEPIVLEFDPRACHATLLGLIIKDGLLQLPAVMHLPSQGSFRIAATGARRMPRWVTTPDASAPAT